MKKSSEFEKYWVGRSNSWDTPHCSGRDIFEDSHKVYLSCTSRGIRDLETNGDELEKVIQSLGLRGRILGIKLIPGPYMEIFTKPSRGREELK